MKPFRLELPNYVTKELLIRAINQHFSVRNVMMKALRATGITIHDADLVEHGRRSINRKLR